MKKTILSIVLLVILISCGKESTCNCGIIRDDDIEFDSQGNSLYTLTVESECSGNDKKVYVSYDTWLDGYVGERICITGVGDWSPKFPIVETIDPQNKEIQ